MRCVPFEDTTRPIEQPFSPMYAGGEGGSISASGPSDWSHRSGAPAAPPLAVFATSTPKLLLLTPAALPAALAVHLGGATHGRDALLTITCTCTYLSSTEYKYTLSPKGVLVEC